VLLVAAFIPEHGKLIPSKQQVKLGGCIFVQKCVEQNISLKKFQLGEGKE
jgi:hypothetical protein